MRYAGPLFGDARSAENVVALALHFSRWSGCNDGTTFPINTNGCAFLMSV